MQTTIIIPRKSDDIIESNGVTNADGEGHKRAKYGDKSPIREICKRTGEKLWQIT